MCDDYDDGRRRLVAFQHHLHPRHDDPMVRAQTKCHHVPWQRATRQLYQGNKYVYAMAERQCCPSRINVIIHPSTATIPLSSTSHARHPCLALTHCAPHGGTVVMQPTSHRALACLSLTLLLPLQFQLLIQESQLTELALLCNQLLSNSWLPKTNTRANFFCREVTSKM